MSQLGFFLGNKELISSSRYFFKFVLILILSLLLIKNYKNIKLSLFHVFLILTFFYYLSHIFGESNFFLVLDGLRYELIYFLIAILLILNRPYLIKNPVLPNLETIIKIFLFQGFVVIIFSIWQLLDIQILEIVYRKSLDELRNIKLAIGFRLVSLLVNPINLGAFMVLFWLASFYLFQKSNSIKVFFVYFLITLISLGVIIGTLSRLALLAFILIVSFLNFYNSFLSKRNLVLFSFIAVISLFFLASLIEDYGIIFSRFESLNKTTEYTNDSRVSNWIRAFGSIDKINFIWGKGIGISSPDSEKVSFYNAYMIENSFISVFLQYGIIGFLCYLIIIIKFFYNAFKIKKCHFLDFNFLLGFLVFFIIMSLGNDFQRNLPFVFYFWIFFAYSEFLIQKQNGNDNYIND